MTERINKVLRLAACGLLLGSALLLTGCSGNVGVGLSVGVPVGNHGYMSIGGSRWY